MSDPLAYFITFTCRGARLHGDPRGTVDRDHNQFGTEFVEGNLDRLASASRRLDGTPVILNQEQRKNVEATIRSVCNYRRWTLHALAVRTNHVHVVVSTGGQSPEMAMGTFKAYATRRLRDARLIARDEKIWTRHGSTIYLWNENAIADAVTYVAELQNDPSRFHDCPPSATRGTP
jgi:REP element-mobilizing transposase RayT